MLQGRSSEFSFSIGDVILAKYEREVYYAKITSINQNNRKAMLLFDDDSKEELSFDSIFSGKLLWVFGLYAQDLII